MLGWRSASCRLKRERACLRRGAHYYTCCAQLRRAFPHAADEDCEPARVTRVCLRVDVDLDALRRRRPDASRRRRPDAASTSPDASRRRRPDALGVDVDLDALRVDVDLTRFVDVDLTRWRRRRPDASRRRRPECASRRVDLTRFASTST